MSLKQPLSCSYVSSFKTIKSRMKDDTKEISQPSSISIKKQRRSWQIKKIDRTGHKDDNYNHI